MLAACSPHHIGFVFVHSHPSFSCVSPRLCPGPTPANEIADFSGVGHLPSLRRLEAVSNKLTSTAGLPALDHLVEIVLVGKSGPCPWAVPGK